MTKHGAFRRNIATLGDIAAAGGGEMLAVSGRGRPNVILLACPTDVGGVLPRCLADATSAQIMLSLLGTAVPWSTVLCLRACMSMCVRAILLISAYPAAHGGSDTSGASRPAYHSSCECTAVRRLGASFAVDLGREETASAEAQSSALTRTSVPKGTRVGAE